MSRYQSYYNQPCRLKLRSGKEVYGVIWTEQGRTIFASLEAFKALGNDRNSAQIKSKLSFISEEEIIGVELLPAIAS